MYGADEAEVKKAPSKAKVIELIEQAGAATGDVEDEYHGEDDEDDGDAIPPNLTPTNPGG